MPKDDREKSLSAAILNAIRLWTYDNDEATVADLKGENGQSYGVQFDLVARVVAAVRKLDPPPEPPAN